MAFVPAGRLLFLPLLLLASAAFACSDKDGSPPPGGTPARGTPTAPVTPGGTETPAARPTPEPLPPGLQKVLDDVARVRGLAAPPQLRASLVARSDLPALLGRLLTDDDRRWFAEATTLYRLLGHLRRDQDYLSVWQSFGSESILGLYSPVDDELWVVHDDGATIDFDTLPRREKETLAHELVHALQDYHFRLDDVYAEVSKDLDLGLAWTAVVEGDATVHEAAYMRQFGAIPFAGGRAWAVADLAQPRDVPASIARELLFPYTTGADWIREVVRQSGTKKVDGWLVNPPPGTAYVLHPELEAAGWKPETVQLPDLAPALGPGWSRESGGTWGEFGVRNYLQLRLRATEAVTAATGWAGDRYGVYVKASESVAAFRVRFSSGAEAAEFAAAQQKFLEGARAVRREEARSTSWELPDGTVTVTTAVTGSEVLFVIGSTREAALRAVSVLAGG